MASKRKKNRDDRRRMCEGKRKYETQQDAIDGIRGVRRDGRQMAAYKCKFCGKFHFGHAPAYVRRAIQRRLSGGDV